MDRVGDRVIEHRFRDGSVARVKRFLAGAAAIVMALGVVVGLGLGARAILETGDGADPDRAFSPTANGVDVFGLAVVWTPDASLDREMEPATRDLLADAWTRALDSVARAADGDMSGLEVWFVDAALDAVIERTSSSDLRRTVDVRPVDEVRLRVDFYSLDGQIVVLSSTAKAVGRDDEVTEAILVLSDGNWRIRHLQRKPATAPLEGGEESGN